MVGFGSVGVGVGVEVRVFGDFMASPHTDMNTDSNGNQSYLST